MVVQKKYVKKQTVITGESYSFFERPFLHQTTPKIASTGLHKKDMKKNLKNKKNKFFKKSLSRKTLLMTVSMVVQKNMLKNRL